MRPDLFVACPKCGHINPPGIRRCDCGFELPRQERQTFYREGSTIVIENRATLPPRCIKCNRASSGTPIKYTFVDSNVGGAPHSAVTALLHFGSRRVGCAYISLCDRHRRLRTSIWWICLALIVIAIGTGIYANIGFPEPPNALVWLATLPLLSGILLLGIYQMHYIKEKVHGGRIVISGAGETFLDSLPPAPEW